MYFILITQQLYDQIQETEERKEAEINKSIKLLKKSNGTKMEPRSGVAFSV